MSTRDEALVAVLNAARAVREQDRGTGRITAGCLAQLYSAIDAVDAVGEIPALPATLMTHTHALVASRPGLCQGDPDCWRYADVGRTCYHHSPHAQHPRPWESLRRRAPELVVQDD